MPSIIPGFTVQHIVVESKAHARPNKRNEAFAEALLTLSNEYYAICKARSDDFKFHVVLTLENPNSFRGDSMIKRTIIILLFGWAVGLGLAVALAQTDPAAGSVPATKLPWWGGIAAIAGVNIALVGLKKVAPKIPAFLIPLVNIGLTAGVTWLGGFGINVPPEVLTTLAISGGAALVHNTVKNAVRGDEFGQGAVQAPRNREL